MRAKSFPPTSKIYTNNKLFTTIHKKNIKKNTRRGLDTRDLVRIFNVLNKEIIKVMRKLISIFTELDFIAKVMVITTVVLMTFEAVGLAAMLILMK